MVFLREPDKLVCCVMVKYDNVCGVQLKKEATLH